MRFGTIILFNILSALRDICWLHRQSDAPARTNPINRRERKSKEYKRAAEKEVGRRNEEIYLTKRNHGQGENNIAYYHTIESNVVSHSMLDYGIIYLASGWFDFLTLPVTVCFKWQSLPFILILSINNLDSNSSVQPS